VKFLVDANLSPDLVKHLCTVGPECVHVADVGLLTATDEVIFDYAAQTGMTIITADSDFPMLLALRQTPAPSVVLLRRVAELPPSEHLELLLANLPNVLADLARGAVVSMAPDRIRVRDLPI
jgi:predicted nuclease of predicted toxin-antitoxin system